MLASCVLSCFGQLLPTILQHNSQTSKVCQVDVNLMTENMEWKNNPKLFLHQQKRLYKRLYSVVSEKMFSAILTVTGPFGELRRYSVRRHPATATQTHTQVGIRGTLIHLRKSSMFKYLAGLTSYLSTAPRSASLSLASPWSSPAPEQGMMSASVYWALPYSKVSSPSTSRSASLSALSLILHVAKPVPEK